MKKLLTALALLFLSCESSFAAAPPITLTLKAAIPVRRLYSLSFIPELQSIAFGESPRAFNIYDLQKKTGQKLFVADDEILSLAYAAPHGIIILGSRDNNIYLVEAASLRTIKKRDMDRQVLQVLKLADGNAFISTKEDNKGFFIVNGKTGKTERMVGDHGEEDHCYGAISRSEEKLLVFGDIDKITLWDFKTGKKIYTVANNAGFTSSLDISSDSRIYAHGNGNGSISVRDLATGDLLYTLAGHKYAVKGVRFIANNSMLVSVEDSPDRFDNKGCSLKIWDLASRKPAYAVNDFCASFLDVFPDERLLAVGGDEIRLYSVEEKGTLPGK